MSTDPVESLPAAPRGVYLIAVILVLEALVAAAAAILSVTTVLGGGSVGTSTFLAVLLALTAAALIALARKLVGGFRWARSPSLVVQLFLVILAFPYFTEGSPVIGLLLLVPAAIVIVTLFSRPVVTFTVRTTESGRTL